MTGVVWIEEEDGTGRESDPPEDADRPSDAPETGERLSSVAIIAACVLCQCAPQWKRQACRNCYRKWTEHGWPLPEAQRPGPRPGDPVQQVVDRMAPKARLVWIRALLGADTIALLVEPKTKK